MIYYDIQHFGDEIEQVKWLCKLVSHPKNRIHVSLDSSKETISNLKSWAKASTFDNISVSKSLKSCWGGPSITHNMVEAVNRAIKFKDWEYFINLSGNCIPLKTQIELHRELSQQKLNGQLSFCNYFVMRKKIDWIKKEDTGIRCIHPYYRLKIYADKAISSEFDNGFNPIKFVAQRKTFFCRELEENNSLEYRGLTNEEIQERKSFISKSPDSIGRQWVILNRSHLNILLNNGVLNELDQALGNSMSFEESFWQMALHNNIDKLEHQVSNESLRYMEGTANYINQDNFNEIVKSESFFARKFDIKKNPQLISKVEQLSGVEN